ncbi:MAG: hypothetical protein ACYTXC_06670 [Nostoc sp.]
MLATAPDSDDLCQYEPHPVHDARPSPTAFFATSAKEGFELNLPGFTQERSPQLQHIFMKNIF